MRDILSSAVLLCGAVVAAGAQPSLKPANLYVIGPADVLSVRVPDLDEFSPLNLGNLRVDPQGDVRLPLAGRIHVAGLGVRQVETKVADGLKSVMFEPEVAVTVTEFGSRPVSVLGAVRNPGLHQITGPRTLFEVLSLAGGLSADAGNTLRITRLASAGPLPLPDVTHLPNGKFEVGTLSLRSVMEATDPDVNIDVLPNDVITVPRGELVYVMGAVKRPGGFVLNEKEQLSVLQALSLAEGLTNVAGSGSARIIRQDDAAGKRSEIPVNVRGILQGGHDVGLHANDILFIPENKAKSAGLRALEVAIQAGTGVVIWRR